MLTLIDWPQILQLVFMPEFGTVMGVEPATWYLGPNCCWGTCISFWFHMVFDYDFEEERKYYIVLFTLRETALKTSGLHDGLGSAVDSQGAASRRPTMAWEEILGGRELVLRFRTPTAWIWCHEWRRRWQPTPVFLTRESHEQRSLAGYIVHVVTKSWTQLNE